MTKHSQTQTCILVATLIAGVLIRPLLAENTPTTAWQAGVASTVITPEEPMWMTGYASRNQPSQGKAQDLWAKVLILQDGVGSRLVIITTDLLGIPRSLRERVETAAAQRFQLKPAELILSASHTHCGPEINLLKGLTWEVPTERAEQMAHYVRSLESKFIGIIEQALDKMVP
ncbi:MAG: neutral/alkaline non-lysosomal ceramidase N-terminal domain-containing protein, partial [bacterium]